MTATGSAKEQKPPEATTVSSESGPRRQLARRWIVVGLVVLAVLGLTLAYSMWWTKPAAFPGSGNEYRFKQTTATMHPVTLDMVEPSAHVDGETVTLNAVSARVLTNTADALITFAVCRRSEASPFMSAAGPAERSCESVTEVEGQQIRLAADAPTTITMTVTPQRHGRVVINGMEVDYTRGSDGLWQRGSQATGPVVKMKVSKSTTASLR